MAQWVRRFLEGRVGKGSVDERLVAEMEGYAQANGLGDDKAGRENVLQVALLMVRYRAAPRQPPKDWHRGRALGRFLSEEERRRAAVTAIAVGVSAEKRVGPEPLLTRNGRADDQFAVAVSRFLARAPGPALADLARGAQQLEQKFGWSVPDATWFILTGEVPLLPPVHVVRVVRPETPYGTVLLEVQPWVSPETVKDIYTEVQRGLRGHRHRAITLKALDRFVFAYRKRTDGDRWSQLFDQYCRKLPRRERTGTWRQFQRDCKRTEMALLHPPVVPAFSQERSRLEQARLAAEAGVSPLVALGMGIRPAEYETARRRLGSRSRATRKPSPARTGRR